ncbi:MAG: hypothetical protein C5B45_03575 [Chlamydiae bacterium]|nr:MAG: hypothetical protein C5B45_03575 [Chlamydiota bacterium]
MSTTVNTIDVLSKLSISENSCSSLSQKEEALKELGLSIIPLSAKATPKRTLREFEEDIRQYDPKATFKSSGICQEEVTALIEELHDKLLYIPYERFKSDLKPLTLELIKHIKNEKYAVGTALRKSNTWVAEHSFQNMSADELPAATFELSRYESTEEPTESFKQAIRDGIKKFVIFDDVIYTGLQMTSHISRCLRGFNRSEEKDLQLIIVVPYVAEAYKRRILVLENRVKLITTDTVIPSISEVIDESSIELLNKIYQKNTYGYQFLVYTDWKVADVKSVPQFLHSGFKLKEGVFRFMRSSEPLFPPYKNRETQELSFEFGSPFENQSKIEFDTKKYLHKDQF